MQIFAIIDLVLQLLGKAEKEVERKQEEDAERLRKTKRSFLQRITKRGAK